ncbi:MAG: methyltransferase domain-containing protein [Myxococcales bacterium]
MNDSTPKQRLRRYLIASQFKPGLFGMITNPFYFARTRLLSTLERVAGKARGRMLDVGCGQKPYRHLFRVDEYVGLEIDTPENRANKQADFFYDGRSFPFADGSFDSVFASQVFEHVFNPEEFLSEVARVLRPGGSLILTLPFFWDEHEQPYDFARYSSFGLSHLLSRHGFRVEELHKSGADLSPVLQAWGMYVFKALTPKNPWLKLATAGLMTAPLNVVGSLLIPLFPENPDLFLDLVVRATRLETAHAGSELADSSGQLRSPVRG